MSELAQKPIPVHLKDEEQPRKRGLLASLATALSKAQGAMDAAKRGKENPYFKSKYSDLASCWEACRSPLSENGLAIVQKPFNGQNGSVGIETYLIHESGEYLSCKFETQPKDRTVQAQGSAITYLRRYSLCAMVGISPDDDDGNSASGQTGIVNPPAKNKTQHTTSNTTQEQKAQQYDDANLDQRKKLFEFLVKDGRVEKQMFDYVAGCLHEKPFTISNIKAIIDELVSN